MFRLFINKDFESKGGRKKKRKIKRKRESIKLRYMWNILTEDGIYSNKQLNKLNIKTTSLPCKTMCNLVHSTLNATYIQTPVFIVPLVRIVSYNILVKHLGTFMFA